VLPSSVLLVLPVNGVSTATEYRMFERQVLRGLSVKVLICQVLIIEKIRAIIGSHFCLSRSDHFRLFLERAFVLRQPEANLLRFFSS
jgi:hypothetical protein